MITREELSKMTGKELFYYVETNIIPKLDIGTANEIIENKYSKVKRTLTPVQVALYDYIMGGIIILNDPLMCISLSSLYHMKTVDFCEEMSIKTDASKSYFRMKWNSIYMDLLD
jgi:hypothetical protein